MTVKVIEGWQASPCWPFCFSENADNPAMPTCRHAGLSNAIEPVFLEQQIDGVLP
jgi:hypothetical protein